MKIALEKGLIALGYGGKSTHLKQTKFSLRLANSLAKKEKVLFLNWNNYPKQINKIIKAIGLEKSEQLEINTEINYYSPIAFLDIIKRITTKNIKTIFIDNIHSFTSENLTVNEDGYKHELIEILKSITIYFDVTIIFNVMIDPEMFSYHYNANENRIDLGYFRWSRNLINDCNQVIAIQDISGYYNTDNDTKFSNNTFNIFNLKNKHHQIESFIQTF